MASKFGFVAPTPFFDNGGLYEGGGGVAAPTSSAASVPKPVWRRWAQYWNTPVTPDGRARADYLRAAGAALRDSEVPMRPPVDQIARTPEPTLAAARGGGVGGVGGGVSRRWRP